jgi:plasmid stabilization system protein ParE
MAWNRGWIRPEQTRRVDKYKVRFTVDAEKDLQRLYDFILLRDSTDWALGQRALEAIVQGIHILELAPFTCRKAMPHTPFLRELIIPFGGTGYVALFEIDDESTVTVLAVRHQREDDYY